MWSSDLITSYSRNILPIPALDGGHVLFLLYEVITRRKPNDKFMEYAQMGGMLFLFALLIYANGNDIFRFFFKISMTIAATMLPATVEIRNGTMYIDRKSVV